MDNMRENNCINDKVILEAVKKAVPVLQKGDRAELIPVKDGVKVVRVRREEVKGNGMDKRKG